MAIPGVDTRMAQSDAALVCHFESLGRGCEFGFLQREAGAEPMGLLRFAGLRLDGLIQGLRTRFAGIAATENVRLSLDGNEYRVEAVNVGFRYHTELFVGDIEPEQLHRLECRKLRFLARQLIEELEGGTKIFVYQQHEPLLAQDLVRLLSALAAYGSPTLLWMLEADAVNKPGTVEVVSDRLLVGYLQCLAPLEAVHQPHVASWMAVCRSAYDIWSATHVGSGIDSAGPADSAIDNEGDTTTADIVFGTAGNSVACQGDGWAQPEARHTWAIGQQSRLTLPVPPGSGDMLLRLFAWPFVRAPEVNAQRLRISVDDVEIAAFRLTAEARLQCPVPAALLDGRQTIDIVFHHPDATQPASLAPGHSDTRDLAIAFRRVSLSRLRNG